MGICTKAFVTPSAATPEGTAKPAALVAKGIVSAAVEIGNVPAVEARENFPPGVRGVVLRIKALGVVPVVEAREVVPAAAAPGVVPEIVARGFVPELVARGTVPEVVVRGVVPAADI